MVIAMRSEPIYDGDDFYCDVAIPRAVPLEVVHEDDLVLAYHHTRPFWQVHLVAVPKRHIASFTTIGATDEADVRALLAVVQTARAGGRGGARRSRRPDQPRRLPGLQAPPRPRALGRAAPRLSRCRDRRAHSGTWTREH